MSPCSSSGDIQEWDRKLRIELTVAAQLEALTRTWVKIMIF